MKRWILRAAVAGAILAVGGFVVAASGVISTKASSGHWAITQWFLRFSMKRSIATHSLGIEVPANLANQNLIVQGARHYEIGCRSCHGAPGLAQPRIARGMLPPPPDLVPRIRESTPGKLFYVVKHGMKFTGMPAWPAQQRDDEIWAMVAFLLRMPGLDEAGYRRLAQSERAPAVSTHTQGPAASSEVATSLLQSCARCHGDDGRNTGGGAFPKLAGQRAEYLSNALAAYARGQRHSGTMGPIAAGLTDGEIRQLARHYSSVDDSAPTPRAAPAGAEAPSDAAIARGRVIATDGLPGQRVPACVECHGPGARRGKPAYPSLAGQSADYLQLQLQLFKREQRGGSAYEHLMRPIASRLTDEQMSDAAAYFETLETAPKNSGAR